MKYSVNDNLVRFNLEEDAVIANTQPMTRLKLGESLDVAVKIITRGS